MADTNPQIEQEYFSPKETAQYTGVTRTHINNLIARGVIPSVKLGRRRLIRRETLDQLLAGTGPDAA